MAHPLFGTIFSLLTEMPTPSFCGQSTRKALQHSCRVGINCRMVTRDYRLSEFNQGPPPPGQSLQLLCEDHNGTYVLPFHCESRNGEWHNPKALAPGQAIQAKVVGWRLPSY
jgi:hypothetical protein